MSEISDDRLEEMLDEYASDIEALAMLEHMAGSAPSRNQVSQAKEDIFVSRQNIIAEFRDRRAAGGEVVAWMIGDTITTNAIMAARYPLAKPLYLHPLNNEQGE